LACSGGSVSQSVGSYFSTSLQKTKGWGGQDRQTNRRILGGWGEAKGRHARKHTLTHTKKSPRETRASDAGREVGEKQKTFKRKKGNENESGTGAARREKEGIK
jgi:hypothetical protein